MNAKGVVHKYGDHVDTDVIIPARYLATQDPKELASHCMEDIDSAFPSKVHDGDIMVAGANFGCGSSREHAVYCLQYAGVPCVLAETCSRIYYRNAINNGYPVLFVKGLSDAIKSGKIKNGDTLEVDLETGSVRDTVTGEEFHGDAVSDFEHEIMEAGGLFGYMKKQAAAKK